MALSALFGVALELSPSFAAVASVSRFALFSGVP